MVEEAVLVVKQQAGGRPTLGSAPGAESQTKRSCSSFFGGHFRFFQLIIPAINAKRVETGPVKDVLEGITKLRNARLYVSQNALFANKTIVHFAQLLRGSGTPIFR